MLERVLRYVPKPVAATIAAIGGVAIVTGSWISIWTEVAQLRKDLVPQRLLPKLEEIAVEFKADLVVVGQYKANEYGQKYSEIVAQTALPGQAIVPEAKYYLSSDYLYDRYRAHLQGDCYARSFQATQTVSYACPLRSDGKLYGYLSVEYAGTTYELFGTQKIFTQVRKAALDVATIVRQ